MKSFSTVDLKSFKDFGRKWGEVSILPDYRFYQSNEGVLRDYVLTTHDFRSGNAKIELFEQYPLFIQVPRQLFYKATGILLSFASESTIITPNSINKSFDHEVRSDIRALTSEEICDRRFGCLAQADAILSGSNLSKAQLSQYAKRDIVQVRQAAIIRSKKVSKNFGVVRDPQIVHYFMVKPPPAKRIIGANYSTDVVSAAYKQRICDRFVEFASKFQEPVKWSNSLMSYVPLDGQAQTASTGYSLVSGLSQYQWCSKALNHIGSAMYDRHLMPNITPDTVHIRKFSRMCARYFQYLVPLIEKNLQGVQFDPFKILLEKQFPKGKMQRYYSNTCEQLQGTLGLVGSFKTMVKSGQVYYGKDFRFQDGCLVGVSDRPRNIMVPSQSLCGLLTLIQSCLWAPLKAASPQFIQGYTKQDLTESFLNGISDSWKSICLDGSGFDSTQHWQCMDACDNVFMNLLRPSLVRLMMSCKMLYPGLTKFSAQFYVDKMLQAATSNINYCFSEVPLIGKSQPWPADAARRFETDWLKTLPKYGKDSYQDNFIPNIINGTVFSGHPTKTTLGNTLRSICYAFYYIQQSGISSPWLNKFVKVRAAGDDVVILCADHLQRSIADSIERMSSRVNRNQEVVAPVGLGQCIKKVECGQWYELDFCSKWCQGTSTNDFHLSRDVKKILVTKLFYTKKNQVLLTRPAVHARAIYEGFKAEKVSRLVEDILQYRYQMFGDNVSQQEAIDFFKANYYSQIRMDTSEGYQAEEQVNARLGISLKDLFDLVDRHSLNL